MMPPISTVCLLGLHQSLRGDHWQTWPEPSLKEYIDIHTFNGATSHHWWQNEHKKVTRHVDIVAFVNET